MLWVCDSRPPKPPFTSSRRSSYRRSKKGPRGQKIRKEHMTTSYPPIRSRIWQHRWWDLIKNKNDYFVRFYQREKQNSPLNQLFIISIHPLTKNYQVGFVYYFMDMHQSPVSSKWITIPYIHWSYCLQCPADDQQRDYSNVSLFAYLYQAIEVKKVLISPSLPSDLYPILLKQRQPS